MSDGIHIQSAGPDDPDEAPIPGFDVEARDDDEIGDAEALPEEDVEAEDDLALEAEDLGIPDEAQPESQGDDLLLAALGEDGQGDLAPEDE